MKSLFSLMAVICLLAAPAYADILRIASYNTYNNPDTEEEGVVFQTIIEALGDLPINGQGRRLTGLALAETDRTSAESLPGLFNSLYGVDSYRIRFTDADGGGDRTGIVFDSSVLELLDIGELQTGLTHHALRLHFRPTSAQAWEDDDFYLYAIHLKSGNTQSDMAIRAAEAAIIRADADALNAPNIIYAGDFNFTSAFEEGFVYLSGSGNGQAFDPADALVEWKDNPDVMHLHTQNPANKLNDRFDLQLVTAGLLDAYGLDYVDGSFQVLGNDGSHVFGEGILSGAAADTSVLNALVSFSDHLPTVAEYAFGEEGVPVPVNNAGGGGALGWPLLSLLGGLLILRMRRQRAA